MLACSYEYEKGTWWAINTEKSMANSNPVSLAKDNTDSILLQVHVNIKGITERFFSLFLW